MRDEDEKRLISAEADEAILRAFAYIEDYLMTRIFDEIVRQPSLIRRSYPASAYEADEHHNIRLFIR